MLNFGPATYGLGLAAGVLSLLSPCVLPLVPVLVASAVTAHRWGPAALGLGLALSFTAIGLLLAAVGASLGLDPETFRVAGAATLALFGVILLIPPLQALFSRSLTAVGASGSSILARLTLDGLTGQFAVGLLLGVVWSPCVGPTLGAATTLASQGRNLGSSGLLMLVFGLGAAAPLVVLGLTSRHHMLHLRGRLLRAGMLGKQIMGCLLLGVGLLILTGTDKPLEAWILDHSPDALVTLTTRF